MKLTSQSNMMVSFDKAFMTGETNIIRFKTRTYLLHVVACFFRYVS